ncbi:YlbG family protein [Siminovitchia sp. 179-K 8D1 HS]|uniref:YlbG family protein n=1 Tax=Siminovitchia sp. 179-K 8D1 HS TaxID=3142385 RepID=UPI0039A1E668
MFTKKQGLIVWMTHTKNIKTLRRFGNIHYVSKRMKYAVLYCNQEELGMISDKLRQLQFVTKVEPSYKPFLKTEFENAKPDKAKEYDYRIGL